MRDAAGPKANGLLAALPKREYQRLLPDLGATTLRTGETLFRPTGRLQWAYFPTSSVVASSFSREAGGAMAKAWPVGREGMVGISLFLGSQRRDDQADVELGGLAFRIAAPNLLAEFRRMGALHDLLLRYVFALLTQASQLGVCGHYHTIEQRLCRFLSRLLDRVSVDEVAFTQERIGKLLGVGRVTITLAVAKLQTAGIIECTRGHVKVIDREQLEQHACACNAIIRHAFEFVPK